MGCCMILVREKGLEPLHLTARAPKTRVSAIPPFARYGRGCRIRTDDLLRPRQALYQAELIPENMVRREGFEPPTW